MNTIRILILAGVTGAFAFGASAGTKDPMIENLGVKSIDGVEAQDASRDGSDVVVPEVRPERDDNGKVDRSPSRERGRERDLDRDVESF